jgi:hypothetical protein
MLCFCLRISLKVGNNIVLVVSTLGISTGHHCSAVELPLNLCHPIIHTLFFRKRGNQVFQTTIGWIVTFVIRHTKALVHSGNRTQLQHLGLYQLQFHANHYVCLLSKIHHTSRHADVFLTLGVMFLLFFP